MNIPRYRFQTEPRSPITSDKRNKGKVKERNNENDRQSIEEKAKTQGAPQPKSSNQDISLTCKLFNFKKNESTRSERCPDTDHEHNENGRQ